jgi:hypothetical protein
MTGGLSEGGADAIPTWAPGGDDRARQRERVLSDLEEALRRLLEARDLIARAAEAPVLRAVEEAR